MWNSIVSFLIIERLPRDIKSALFIKCRYSNVIWALMNFKSPQYIAHLYYWPFVRVDHELAIDFSNKGSIILKNANITYTHRCGVQTSLTNLYDFRHAWLNFPRPVYCLPWWTSNIFRVTGHLCGEFTGPRWIPHTKASDADLWCFLWSASE